MERNKNRKPNSGSIMKMIFAVSKKKRYKEAEKDKLNSQLFRRMAKPDKNFANTIILFPIIRVGMVEEYKVCT